MALSEKQLEDMYEASLRCSINLTQICKQMENGDIKFEKHEGRLSELESEQSLLKGKLGAFILILTLCATIIINGFVFIIGHLFGKT